MNETNPDGNFQKRKIGQKINRVRFEEKTYNSLIIQFKMCILINLSILLLVSIYKNGFTLKNNNCFTLK